MFGPDDELQQVGEFFVPVDPAELIDGGASDCCQ